MRHIPGFLVAAVAQTPDAKPEHEPVLVIGSSEPSERDRIAAMSVEHAHSDGVYVWPAYEPYPDARAYEPYPDARALLADPPDLIAALHDWSESVRPEPRNRHERRAQRHRRSR